MKLCEANMRTVLDILASNPNLSGAGRAIGGSAHLIFQWLKKSSQGSETTLVSWPDKDSPKIQFGAAVQLARKFFIVEYEHQTRHEIAHGVPRVVLHEGQVQYQRDPALVGRGPELLKLLDLPDDLLRIDGKVQPLVVYDAAPAHLKIRALAAMMPAMYGEHKHLSIDSNISGGVRVLSDSVKPPVITDQTTTTYRRNDGTTVTVQNKPPVDHTKDGATHTRFNDPPPKPIGPDGYPNTRDPRTLATIKEEPEPRPAYTPPANSTKQPTMPVNLGDAAKPGDEP